MNTYLNRTVFVILILVILGLLSPQIAHAQDIEVKTADPSSAEQGTFGLDVKLSGTGFAKGAKVRFFLVENEEDDGRILVNSVKVRGSKSLIVNIDVPDDAVIGEFNAEVELLNGRKGKGTARLFFVKAKKEVFTCADKFGVEYPDVCNCTFGGNNGFVMQDSCFTHETLVIPQFGILNAELTGATLTALAPFTGSSVIGAEGHRATVHHFKIDIGPKVDAGCGSLQLNSAIGFVLDDYSADPHDAIYLHTWWEVWLTTISTRGDPLCHAMEFSRTDSYEYPDSFEGRVMAYDNVITAGSYSKTGILYRGFGPFLERSSVYRNTIGAAAVADAADANAIQFGPNVGDGVVERNLISLDDGTGVLVVGDGLSTDVKVNQNDVEGAFVGVLVDGDVLHATIKSNILTGANVADSVGACSDAMSNLFRANRINDYDDDIVEGGCSELVSPAE